MKFLLVAGYADSLVKFRGVLLRSCVETGARVHAAAPVLDPNSSVADTLEDMNVRLHSVPLHRTGLNPLCDIVTLYWLSRLIWRIRPDIVLAYTIKPVIYGMLAAWFAGVHRRYALITGIGYVFTEEIHGKRRLLQWLVRHLYRLALTRTHKVFFQNPDDEALFRQLEILPAHVPSVVVNGSGVDIDAFQSVAIPCSPVRFLLIARLLGAKGVRIYADAARQVKAKYPQVIFNLVGWIDINPDAITQSEVDEWVDDEIIDYWGHLDDVRPAIASSSVFVLPSYREGTPRTVLEAMAMGRPIITTDAPGCRETVVHGRNGFLVPIEDAHHLADAMFEFIKKPDLIKHMGDQSRRIAEEKYDVNKVNATMLREMGIV